MVHRASGGQCRQRPSFLIHRTPELCLRKSRGLGQSPHGCRPDSRLYGTPANFAAAPFHNALWDRTPYLANGPVFEPSKFRQVLRIQLLRANVADYNGCNLVHLIAVRGVPIEAYSSDDRIFARFEI